MEMTSTKRGNRGSAPAGAPRLLQHPRQQQKQQQQQQPYGQQPGPKRHDEAERSVSHMQHQPDTRPISHQQLVTEVKAIYKGLVLVESKRIEVDSAQSAQEGKSATELTNEQWQALGALHRAVLHEHHDLFLASQHHSASPPLKRLASKYSMPARMWRHGIHSYIELLRHRLPESSQHTLGYTKLSYDMMALLYETVPTYKETWVECLGNLGVPNPFEFARGTTLTHSAGQLPDSDDRVTGPSWPSPSGVRSGLSDAALESLRQRREFYVSGELAGTPVVALPDTGADACFISPDLASRLNLIILPRTNTVTRLPTGKHVKSPGIVEVPWRFEGEAKTHLLRCRILPGCIHSLVLGNPFLQATETLTKFRGRIKSKFCSSAPKLRLRLLGEGRQHLQGYFNDQLIGALPDTGSDLMLVSESFARRQGLKMDRSPRNRLEVEFADGTTACTEGVVTDVEWRVGDDEMICCDFYVLEGLREDVILSNAYLFDMDVFSRYADCLVDKDCYGADSELFNIRLIGWYSDRLDELEVEYAIDMKSRDAFGPLKTQKELVRRDKIRDEIRKITAAQTRAEAEVAEDMRQKYWELMRDKHRKMLSSQAASTDTFPNRGGEDLESSRGSGRREEWRRRMGEWRRRMGEWRRRMDE